MHNSIRLEDLKNLQIQKTTVFEALCFDMKLRTFSPGSLKKKKERKKMHASTPNKPFYSPFFVSNNTAITRPLYTSVKCCDQQSIQYM